MRNFIFTLIIVVAGVTAANAQGRLNTWVGSTNANNITNANFLNAGNWTFTPANGDILYINNASIRITGNVNITLTNIVIRLGAPGGQTYTLGIPSSNSVINFNITASSSYDIQTGGSLFVAGTTSGTRTKSFQIGGVVKVGNFNTNTNNTVTGPKQATSSTPAANAGAQTQGFIFGALPVVLVNFDAVKQGNGVALTWKTQQESNTDFFAIEKSTDGAVFTEIGRVQAAGNASTPRSYSYADNSSLKGIAYYRVRIVDLDGKVGLTPVKAVRASAIGGKVGIYPNPAVSIANIVIDNPEYLSFGVNVFNRNGQLVAQKRAAAGTTVVPLEVSTLPAGDYMVDIQFSNGTRTSIKLLVNR